MRWRIALFINGSYWLGTGFGARLAMVLLDTNIFPADVGWRLAFGLGAVLGLAILVVQPIKQTSQRGIQRSDPKAAARNGARHKRYDNVQPRREAAANGNQVPRQASVPRKTKSTTALLSVR